MDLTDFQRRAILLIFISILAGSILLARKEPLIVKDEKKPESSAQYSAKLDKEKQTKIEEAPLKIDINTADSNSLVKLPGIGPILANNIIAYRTEHGHFKVQEDLLDVPGIGEKKLSRMRDMIDLPIKTQTTLTKPEKKDKNPKLIKSFVNPAETSASETIIFASTIYDSRLNEKTKCPYCNKQLWEKGDKKQAYIRCPHCMKLLS